MHVIAARCLQRAAQLVGDGEHDVLFPHPAAERSRIDPAMAGIDNDDRLRIAMRSRLGLKVVGVAQSFCARWRRNGLGQKAGLVG